MGNKIRDQRMNWTASMRNTVGLRVVMKFRKVPNWTEKIGCYPRKDGKGQPHVMALLW